jgi:hypothetical protein
MLNMAYYVCDLISGSNNESVWLIFIDLQNLYLIGNGTYATDFHTSQCRVI